MKKVSIPLNGSHSNVPEQEDHDIIDADAGEKETKEEENESSENTLPPSFSTLNRDDKKALYSTCGTYEVDLKEGEMLYLPASWFHEVLDR